LAAAPGSWLLARDCLAAWLTGCLAPGSWLLADCYGYDGCYDCYDYSDDGCCAYLTTQLVASGVPL